MLPFLPYQYGNEAALTVSGLLLDKLSVPALRAYGSRKLRSAYAGNALQVTTSAAGNATQDIGFVANNLDTTSLASFIGSNSGTVSIWYDQSTNAVNCTQATLSLQPRVVNAGTNDTLNGHVAPRGNGSTWLQMGAGSDISQAVTIAICFRIQSSAASAHLTDGVDSSKRLLCGFNAGFTAYEIFAGGSTITGGTPDTTSTHTGIWIFNSASSEIVLDGSVIAGPANAGSDVFNSQYIFRSNAGNTLNSNIAEILFFNGALSASDQSTIRSIWQSYWGAV